MRATRRVRTTDSIELAVFESGEPAPGAPTVVAVHGYPDNHTVWDGVAGILAESHRVVTYDVRGAGDSDKPSARAPYRLGQLVDDLAAVLDAVSPDRPVHLLGHDWGSVQCWAAVADPRLRSRIASFTSVSGPSLDHARAWLRDLRHPRATARQLLDSWYIAAFQIPGLAEAAWRSGWADALMRIADRAGRSAAAPNRHRSGADMINGLQLYRANVLPRLGRPAPGHTDVPVLVLAPRDDAFISVALQTQAPAPYVPDLRSRVISGGHWVVIDRPDVIARAVIEFIEQVGGAPENPAGTSPRRPVTETS